MKFNIDYNVGDYFTGVLLETFKEAGISRPRVKPVEMFADDIRVEFPRSLREDNPETRGVRTAHVLQKDNDSVGCRTETLSKVETCYVMVLTKTE